MNTGNRRKGFSLIEVVIASAIIVSIFSILFGTYFAIANSTKAVRAKQKTSQQARDTVARLTKQIRCSYANYTISANDDDDDKKKEVNYFYGHSGSVGDMLSFVTTNSFFVMPQNSSQELLNVSYKFNRNDSVLFISQQRFLGQTKKTEKKQWVTVADNVESFKLEYFDGRNWSNKWTFKDLHKQPNAVKIDIAFKTQTDRIYKYSTVVNIFCVTDHDKKTVTDKLAAANNR